MTVEKDLLGGLQIAARESCGGEAMVDPVLLAEFLDRTLPEEEQKFLEEHLAHCRHCRELAAESAESLHWTASETSDVPALEKPRSWFGRPWIRQGLAAAALLTVGLLGLWTRSTASFDDRLAWMEVEASSFAALSKSTRDQTLKALDGDLEVPVLFEGFLDSEQRSVLRGASSPRVPEPIAPRWTRTRDPRPLFRGSTGHPLDNLLQGEILLVDEEEQWVASLEFESRDSNFDSPWPADQAPLEPGIYAWKINAELDGEWVSSEYVPFQVVEIDEDLPKDAFPRGVHLASLGYLGEALETLLPLNVTEEGREILHQILEEIALRQRLSPEILQELLSESASSDPETLER